ncbi:MAG: ketoacyl-ACP synthase III [Saprospiraceae bacterium]|nr:ketoacyl-ACP synthase III [Saprospiraceae bacterium]
MLVNNTIISGVGSYVPLIRKKNNEFLNHVFLNDNGTQIQDNNENIIEKFTAITGITERRYAGPEFKASDLGYFAAEKAIQSAGIDRETLDYIILAHNFGDVKSAAIQSDIMPSLASRVKHRLGIKNPDCVSYDILFGCPGWIEGVIQGHAYIKAGFARKVLVIGTETLSRVLDPHDRDSMIYSDGAGACVLESREEYVKRGILSHATRSDTINEVDYLYFGNSYDKEEDPDVRYIKMYGRKIYEYALKNVPVAMKYALDSSAVDINNLKKVFLHQANEKMDEAIIQRFYKLHGLVTPDLIMPMNIHFLGNSSVATVPTLFDMVLKGEIPNQQLNEGDVIMMASVGAGMNINALIYKM